MARLGDEALKRFLSAFLFAAVPALFVHTGCRGAEQTKNAAVAAPPAALEGWRAIARLPRARDTKAVVALDGAVYFLSGGYADGPTNDVISYDLASRRWSERAPVPQILYNQDAAALDGKIYMAGGCIRGDCSSPSRAAYAYDPKSDFWTVLPPLPEPVYAGLSAAINGRYVVFGGVANKMASRRVYAYSPRANSWTRLADIPGPRSHAAGALLGGRFFLTGGCKSETQGHYCDEVADDVFIYDPATGVWSSGPSLPVPVHAHGAAADGTKLIIAGGGAATGGVMDGGTYMLASGDERWTRGPDILRARFVARLFSLPRGVGLFGPSATNNPEDIIEALGAPGPYIDPGTRAAVPAPRRVAARLPSRAPVAVDFESLESLPSPVAARPHAHAVIIGIERYREKIPRADFAAGDAKLAAEYFHRVLGVPEENLVLLGDERATKSDFEKYFERWLPNRVEKGDEVFVYFSGHGAPNSKTGESYLVPYDADPTYIEQTGYSVKRLYAQLAKLPAKRTVLVLDSCFSGAGGRSVIAKGARPLVAVAANEVPRGLLVISASASDQISNSYEEKRHGLFTYFFLKGLRDKKGDLRAAYDYLKPQVTRVARREYNADQVPQWSKGR